MSKATTPSGASPPPLSGTSPPQFLISERLREGRRRERAARQIEDQAKLGTLRAGNSGVLSAKGDSAGGCLRVAHLRTLGIEVEPPDDSTMIMFQAGTANEDIIYKDLLHTCAPNELILRETEIPIRWMTSTGTPVTGRPDMVLCRRVPATDTIPEKTVPVLGIELKSVHSVWTSRDVLFGSEPKTDHLIQSAHYSWQLGAQAGLLSGGIPFRLLYKQYSNQVVPQWAERMFPSSGEPFSEHIEYNDRGGIKCIRPFEIAYELEWDASGTLHYRREHAAQPDVRPGARTGRGGWVKTLVRYEDIQRFFEHAAQLPIVGLGSRPSNPDPTGKEEKKWTKCSYCPLKNVCDSTDKTDAQYPEWIAAVRAQLGQKSR